MSRLGWNSPCTCLDTPDLRAGSVTSGYPTQPYVQYCTRTPVHFGAKLGSLDDSDVITLFQLERFNYT